MTSLQLYDVMQQQKSYSCRSQTAAEVIQTDKEEGVSNHLSYSAAPCQMTSSVQQPSIVYRSQFHTLSTFSESKSDKVQLINERSSWSCLLVIFSGFIYSPPQYLHLVRPHWPLLGVYKDGTAINPVESLNNIGSGVRELLGRYETLAA